MRSLARSRQWSLSSITSLGCGAALAETASDITYLLVSALRGGNIAVCQQIRKEYYGRTGIQRRAEGYIAPGCRAMKIPAPSRGCPLPCRQSRLPGSHRSMSTSCAWIICISIRAPYIRYTQYPLSISMADDQTALQWEAPPELATAITAAVQLHPDAFPSTDALLLEAVSRLVSELATDPDAATPRGIDYAAIKKLVARWLDRNLAAAPRAATRVAESSAGAASRAPVEPVEIDNGAALAPGRAVGDISPPPDISITRLREPPPGTALSGNGSRYVLADEPLFGLHNRDYPSLWAASHLYERAADGPVGLKEFLAELTKEAWEFSEALAELEIRGWRKLRALFPSNRQRPESAEDGFRAFAVGSIHAVRGGDGLKRLSGPLFQWRLAYVIEDGGRELIGRTAVGAELLTNLAGISLNLPHEPEYARVFLAHLMEHAPEDWALLRRVLELAAERANRATLVEQLQKERSWSPSQASSYAVGYVGRAREWGLMESQLSTDRRYELTELGREYLSA